MEKGDISNDIPPRLLFVFEGLVGKLTGTNMQRERAYVRLKRYKKAVNMWDIDDAALSHIWDAVWRHDLALDIVTFVPYWEELRDRLDDEGVPYGHLRHYAHPDVLAMKLAYMPYVYRIYFAYPMRPHIFGDRGVFAPQQKVFSLQ